MKRVVKIVRIGEIWRSPRMTSFQVMLRRGKHIEFRIM
jgi:hypothetical protein